MDGVGAMRILEYFYASSQREKHVKIFSPYACSRVHPCEYMYASLSVPHKLREQKPPVLVNVHEDMLANVTLPECYIYIYETETLRIMF